MRRILVLLLAAALMGCAKIQLSTQCPTNSTGVGFALAGSTIGNQALSMLGGIASKAGVMAGPTDTAAPATTATLSYEYLAIWGPDSGSLACTIPPQQTVVVTSPPASIVTH